MNKKRSYENEIIRTPNLLKDALKKVYFPWLMGSTCNIVAIAVDSIVAGRIIGTSALAAIALMAPFLAINCVLHGLFGMGVTTIVVTERGKGNIEKANRYLATILMFVALAFGTVFFFMGIFADEIFGLMTNEVELINEAKTYALPIVLTWMPFELGLVLERGYMVDGRAKLFVMHPIVTNVLNTVLDIVFIVFLGTGIGGLAWATVISKAAGYMISLSHGFSKKCTVKPDFSVIKKPSEMKEYLVTNFKFGGNTAIKDAVSGFVTSLICKILLVSGGAVLLAIWNILINIMGIVDDLMLGSGRSMVAFCGMLNGTADYKGVKYIARRVMIYSLSIMGVISICVYFFGGLICRVYGIDPSWIEAGRICLRFSALGILGFGLISPIQTYFTSIGKLKHAYVFSLTIMPARLLVILLSSMLGGVYIFAGNSLVYMIYAVIMFVVMYNRDNWLLPEVSSSVFFEASNNLNNDNIAMLSKASIVAYEENGYSGKIASRVGLLMEESLCDILKVNEASNNNDVNVDIMSWADEQRIYLTVCSDGVIYNPFNELQNEMQTDTLSIDVIKGLTEEVKFDRILDLNYTKIKLRKDVSSQDINVE